MITSENLVALVLVITAAGIMFLPVILSGLWRRKSARPVLNSIPALETLLREVRRSVEGGGRLHISLGSASILDRHNASALAGLASLDRLTQTSLSGDRPAVCTAGNPVLAILAQDTMRGAFRDSQGMDQYHIDQASLAGVTPFSYAAGAMPTASMAGNSANIFIGHFGPEAGLLSEAASRKGIPSLVCSDGLEAQAVGFASAEDALIGEQLFALPAYLRQSRTAETAIRAQDTLRWILIGIILSGAAIKLFFPSFGGGIF